ncbi:hypothetical protein JL2886_01278 [Phaeobacter gallaeciensis]|jgi:hypothetical protein|uniref:Uncharacterized protein n=2 Tax=Phaeobacter gallaeciensis TaxID=60890 RepID=A0A1B0ZPU4_9RHOB|nr:hypothetical protein [Phaeobacter gallaeciensis]MEE2817943.1 hypothetical protein [Pseudomonadota bacterium]ANP36197.1 hypothetical protein JL2886_01278 [Phaeobacter gallaeciensis]MDE4063336.1 hypothetical protein [Phaeobacter gallaeciensis]MDE4126377.1 hypothetical protein [Phaeobacter gallaeciensis]MDE4298582.1 hypothetical protein [Phaeobacter gallaeciensis]
MKEMTSLLALALAAAMAAGLVLLPITMPRSSGVYGGQFQGQLAFLGHSQTR